MLIAICDDDIKIRQRIMMLCKEILKDREKSIDDNIILFSDGKELIEYSDDPDIILLDIEMPNMNGILVKQKLQDFYKRMLIIFVTNHSEMIRDAIGINVFGFVDKKMINEQLPVILRQAIDVVNKDVVIDGRIRSSNIKYIESAHVYCVLVMEDGQEYSVRITMNELQNMLLCSDFVRVHRKYIVNMNYIDKIIGRRIYIEDKEIPITDSYIKKVKKEYNAFCM